MNLMKTKTRTYEHKSRSRLIKCYRCQQWYVILENTLDSGVVGYVELKHPETTAGLRTSQVRRHHLVLVVY